MPEARDGLRSGKVPRKAGLTLHANGIQYDLNLNPEAMAIGSAKLPEVEEADTPRVLFEERIALLRELCKTIDGIFAAFVNVSASSAWAGQVSCMLKCFMQQATNLVAAFALTLLL